MYYYTLRFYSYDPYLVFFESDKPLSGFLFHKVLKSLFEYCCKISRLRPYDPSEDLYFVHASLRNSLSCQIICKFTLCLAWQGRFTIRFLRIYRPGYDDELPFYSENISDLKDINPSTCYLKEHI